MHAHSRVTQSGIFFGKQTADSVTEAIAVFEQSRFDGDIIRRHAEGFDSSVFRARLSEFIDGQMRARRGARQPQPVFALAGD